MRAWSAYAFAIRQSRAGSHKVGNVGASQSDSPLIAVTRSAEKDNPTMSKNPHTFLTNIAGTPGGLVASAIAFKAQNQIATFFATNGAITIDPDDAPPALPATFPHVFETPIVPPLPETLNFIP